MVCKLALDRSLEVVFLWTVILEHLLQEIKRSAQLL